MTNTNTNTNTMKIKELVEIYRQRMADKSFELDSVEKWIGDTIFWPTIVLGENQEVVGFSKKKFYLEVSYEIRLIRSPLGNEIPAEIFGLERYSAFVDPYDGLEYNCFRLPLE